MNRNFIPEMGFSLRRCGEGLEGECAVGEDLCVPGTHHLRASVLVLWADVICGLQTAAAVAPKIPATLELGLEMFRPAPLGSTVRMFGRVVKSGNAVTHAEVEMYVDDEPAGLGSASFMLAPGVEMQLPELDELLAGFRCELRIGKPYAERVGSDRLGPGRARLPKTPDTINASDTIHGGLVALAIEEAVLAAEPPGTVVTAMGLRYVRPARVGPAVAVAEQFGERWKVDVQDAGAGDRSCVHATVTTGPAEAR
ncbi:MAG TPA: hotdog domain-containing protein [Nocardioides sp.]|nr:hotdog domain-containing protein [Nocardioides sp.]